MRLFCTKNQTKLLGLILILLFILPALALHAQTAERLEALLNEPEVKWQQAVTFVLEAADIRVENPNDAFRFAKEQKWLPKNVSSGDTVLLNGIALLLMQSFDIKGGIFYRIFKSPHHAYRELVYKNVIRGNADPHMLVSGEHLLLMINRILTMKEEL